MTSHSKRDYITCVKLYCDGACPGQRGAASLGVVLFDEDFNQIELHGQIIGPSTVNAAEYKALIEGLDRAAKHTRRRVECYLDSDVVEGQMAGRYRLRNDNLRRLFHSAKDRERPFEEVVYCKVQRNDQRLAIAHQLAHDSLNGRTAPKR